MAIHSLQELHELGASYWRACVLHATIRLKVFTHLNGQTLEAAQIAGLLGTEPRATALLLNAAVALGLLEKEHDRYRNTEFSQSYLDESSPEFMGSIIYHFAFMYQTWGHLEEAVRTGKSITSREERSEEANKRFLLGMHNLAVRGASALSQQLDLSGARTLLDLGGGPGTYSLSFCQTHPQLSATIFDLPGTERIALEKTRSYGLEERVHFTAGNFHEDPLPEGPFDIVFMSHILHGSSVEQCAELIRRVAPIVKPGGEVIIQEFVLNEEKTEPTFAAIFALNMLIHTPGGRTFSFGEIKAWLEDAGFVDVRQECYDLPNDASLVRGRKVE